MDNQTIAQRATSNDQSRQAATGHDASPDVSNRYTVSIDRALMLYESAGFARTRRALQRHAQKGDVDATLIDTPTGKKYLIALASIERHLAHLKELDRNEQLSRSSLTTDTEPDDVEDSAPTPPAPRATIDQPTRPAPTNPAPAPMTTAPHADYTSQLETRIKEKDDQIDFLRREVSTKNKQLEDASERGRETNTLIQGLQHLVLQLTGNDRQPKALQSREAGSRRETPDPGFAD